MIEIKFPDGSIKKFESGVTGYDVALSISEGLARMALAVEIDGKLKDLHTTITSDANIRIITFRDPEGVEIFRHSSAHILAQAVEKLYPGSKATIGPAIENGFYYDFDNLNISIDDFPKIEEEMKKIVKEDLKPQRIEFSSKAEAKKAFKDNSYKLELVDSADGDVISAYKQGEFIDLCRGPHVPSTKVIKSFKLMKLAGAYWRGDSKNKQLTRIYGTSFPDSKLLNDYLKLLEEAEKRDHRKIGKELGWFSFHQEAPGMPFFHDGGTFIWNELVKYISEIMMKRDYEINKTPIILNKSLWLQSGHWDHYANNMYFTKIDEQDYAVKPMNCPGNILVFKNNMYSYRDLPLRAGEFGLVHRHELSGVLSGLFRVRCFTQDDAHVFCTREQIKDEVVDLLDFVNEVYSKFGFEYFMELSTRPEKAMGDSKLWDLAENTLKEVLEDSGKGYKINEGDGAFYGPKIDFHLKDAIGREWQCATIQLDFQMPEKFDLTYEGADGQKHRPVMLHRTILGSVERFLGVLIEHFTGKLPVWLNPNQVSILPIADRHIHYSNQLKKELKELGVRATIDSRSETINKKVRDAQLNQFNYILVVGDKEIENESVTVRTRNNEILGSKNKNDFISEVVKEIKERK
ncbi:MAG: threonine--tRNA ligase [Candidatus Nanoarchaeia archaeon]|nr:threonine--tRNA ligase [Candidatus Nanoarchaeia archaeon]